MSSYEPKNILITGGMGFIGSHVVQWFVETYPQYHIVNLDCLDYCSNLRNTEKIKDYPNYTFIEGDICSSDFMRHILTTYKIDTILHFAAQSHVDNSFGNSFAFTKVNIMGTHILLEAARRYNVSRFIHVSTDEVYGENNGNQFNEERILEPTNPYAATKASAELIAKSYHRSFGLPLIITRSNNVYGSHQYPEKLIPKLISRALMGEKLQLHGDGLNERSYVYVEDVVYAFDILTHKGEIGQIYNIGIPTPRTNRDVAHDILRLMNIPAEGRIEFVEDRLYNDKRYLIDSSRLYELKWHPKISWLDGLQNTIDWYRENQGYWGGAIENAIAAHPSIPTRSFARDEYDQ